MIKLAKNRKEMEEESQKWYEQMCAYSTAKDYDAFNKNMSMVKHNYQIDSEILMCISDLVENIAPTTDITVNSEIVFEIQITNHSLRAYKIITKYGTIGFFILSKVLPFTDDGIPNSQRRGKCHRKSFEIASNVENNVRLVTGLVSILSEKFTYLHSWIEDYDSECAFDYTMNVGLSIKHYRALMHAQTPILEIESNDIKTGKIKYKDWAKKIYDLYYDERVDDE